MASETERPDTGHHKYAHLESERRFLVREIPDGVTRVSEIDDVYLQGSRLRMESGGTVVRKLGQKIRLNEGPRQIAQTTMYLDDADWNALSVLPGRQLHKRRHHVEQDGLHIAVDEFDDGTLVAEIDGGDAAPTLVPDWLAVIREVTDDEEWTGAVRAARASQQSPSDGRDGTND